MNRNDKAELAVELKDKFSKAHVALFADYKGLKASQADDLRRLLRPHRVEVKVLKNNVARMVSEDGSFGSDAKALMDTVVGPTLVAFAFGDPAAAAKVLHKFASENEALKIKTSLMGRMVIQSSAVEELAKLPSREALLGKMLGTLNAPITNFVGVLAAMPRSLVTVLSAIENKKAESQS